MKTKSIMKLFASIGTGTVNNYTVVPFICEVQYDCLQKYERRMIYENRYSNPLW